MMINCKESAIRSSQLRDQQLKGMRKIELWYHLLICKFCRIYDKQIRMLGKLSRLIGETSSCAAGPPDAKLSEDAKSRIKKSISAK
ncbi:MAG: hypothetical protein JSW58_12050 [Candidatus Latescibacterota bacterium]|nr:MAG: hypothetical protein JSW58_12050 [Candidatus Latescibacterota bacterium]